MTATPQIRTPLVPASPGQALSASLESETMGVVATVGDTALDAVVSSGSLDGLPIFSVAVGLFKAQRELRDHLYAKKVVSLLHGVGSASTQSERDAFVAGLRRKGQAERFGETVLLLLEQVDDAQKPNLMGRILAAHMSGKIASYDDAMRLIAMINRAYAVDLNYLLTMKSGVQRGTGALIAASLESVGLLVNGGTDGGGFDQEKEPGGVIYHISTYGQMLLSHGLV